MNAPAVILPRIRAMSTASIEKVRRLEARMAQEDQLPLVTKHVLHGGMYFRTITLKAGAALTGALIKIPTALIVSGHVSIFNDGETIDLVGYHVIPASAGRKQVILAHADTDMTMVFPSQAKTVEQAEAEFTDEGHLLVSRHQSNDLVIITGE